MPRRKPVVTDRRIRDIGRKRIRIPQPPDRPIRLIQRRPIRAEKYKPSHWWFIEHRRGVYRPLVGEDPLEARAVKEETVRGTLPERIVYKWLVSRLRMVPDVDFDFQSSLQGGRMELGGILADFLFQHIRIILQVQGPTHTQYLRSRKDEEQRQLLAEMGYTVYEIDVDTVYNEERFEDVMRRIFFIRPGYNAFPYTDYNTIGSGDGELDPVLMQKIYDTLVRIESTLEDYAIGGL